MLTSIRKSIDCLKEEKGNIVSHSHCLIGTYKGQVWIKRNSSNLWDKRASANTLLNADDYATAMYANGAQNLFAIAHHGGTFSSDAEKTWTTSQGLPTSANYRTIFVSGKG